jgi:hypothetical protein
MKINAYDIDGVIYMGPNLNGVTPGPNDVIITGRSYEESVETLAMLNKRGITNPVFFNCRRFDDKTRETSGEHKATTLNRLFDNGVEVGIFFEDDPVQAKVIRMLCARVTVVELNHNLTEKENVRR